MHIGVVARGTAILFSKILNMSLFQVLDNGLLVDPHDQQSIADALLKLVSNKQLWVRCRQNGLNNIHLFSWPEHCKTYLSRITSCKPRKPQWQKSDDGFETSESDSPGDSLRDIKDLSLNLKLSLDGEKIEGSGTFDNALDSEENTTEGNSRLVNAVLELSKDAGKNPERAGSIEKADSNTSKSLTLRRRKFIFVIALDFEMNSDFLDAMKVIVEAAADNNAGSIGFILSTASSISEIISLLESGGLSPMDFDAFICNSGSELYYPSSNSEGGPSGLPVIPDFDYHSHIGYRWGGEGLRKTLVRWAANINEKKGAEGEQIVEDESGSATHCCAFKLANPEMVWKFSLHLFEGGTLLLPI